MSPLEVDVAIIGAGFGGSLLALTLRRAGLRVALLDRAAHPRFAIGESSTPIANLVLADLCREYDLPRIAPLAKYGSWQAAYPQLGCGIKRGFSYFHHVAGQPFAADARHSTELLVAASRSDQVSDTHWLRQDVDAFLFHEAAAAGADCFENCEVADIVSREATADCLLSPVIPRSEQWIAARSSKPELPPQLRARFVVDAAGEGGVLAHRLNIPDKTHELRTRSRAVFAHFGNVTRWRQRLECHRVRVSDHPFDCDHAALHHVFADGWMWQLRFNDETVSAGFVENLSRKASLPCAGLTAGEEWRRWLQRFPSIADQYASAQIVRPDSGLRRTGRLQRKLGQVVGPWWALLPNTAGFIDALQSSGIAHTLCGIERLSRILCRHLGRDDLTARLSDYERCVLAELELIDLMVSCCFAATGEFRRFVAASMLYFAAATRYERTRLASRGEFAPAFLLADNMEWRNIVLALSERLTDSAVSVEQIESELAAAIRPFNVVGLCDAANNNMYRHSALPD